MRRELKVARQLAIAAIPVAKFFPMRRELKDISQRLYPAVRVVVAKFFPMRRELKGTRGSVTMAILSSQSFSL